MSMLTSAAGRWLLAIGIGTIGVLTLSHQWGILFDTSDFPARWYCGQWTSLHGWTHICSDVAIWGAYTAIPLIIVFFVRRRKDMVFPRILWLFAGFILACGTVHLVESMIFWWPVYRLSAVTKVATAVVSWATVVALAPIVPKLLALPDRMMDIQAIIEHAPTAMLLTDHQGNILMVNEQTEMVFGYMRSELIGKQVEMLVPSSVRGHHPSLVESFFRNPRVTQLGEGRELFGLHKDGHEIPVEIGLTPLVLHDEHAVLACIVNQTIQKQRREKELAELSQVLSLGEVVGGLAHELNTPIQRIVTWAGVLELEDSPDQRRETTKRIVLAAKEVGGIIHQLRDTVIHRETADQPLNLNDVIRDTVTFMHREVTGVRVNLADDLPQVSGDPIQLQLVVSNLIRNAYQAGGPVTITTCARNGQVACWVDDCGPGVIEPSKRLFDSFYTTKPDGLGMGLTITQAIIRRFGGRISALNTEQGARFEFTLPTS